MAQNIERIRDLSEWDEFLDPEGEGRTRILPNIGGMQRSADRSSLNG